MKKEKKKKEVKSHHDILHDCYEAAKKCIHKCSTPHGIYASGGPNGYNAVWARDSMITSLGASLCSNEFKEVFENSIITLGDHQSKNGQIPNCVDKWEERSPHVDYKSVDSTMWYIIGNHAFKERFNDDRLLIANKKLIDIALFWLACQDTGEVGMITQLPTSDWQDAFPHRYGYTINSQALYYKVLTLVGNLEAAEKLKCMVNDDKDDSLWNGNFYLPYRWKNHGKYKEIGDWFDSLGNILAILFGLADEEKSKKILDYIKKKNIAKPSAIRDIYPPIDKNSKYWQDYYLDCMAGIPNQYSNGGIWGYIGCFYALALIKFGKIKEAEEELVKIAKNNLKYGFPEWVHPKTGKVLELDKLQAWEAGCYILAYESLKQKKVLI
ncbi:MAG: glycoside hydrolase 100 family protein [Nanoarchaeota archaeon]|nr:glycoside hydrolase 100 family protein [Nanoarchaeota archaeon]